jgi:hypothetical protein
MKLGLDERCRCKGEFLAAKLTDSRLLTLSLFAPLVRLLASNFPLFRPRVIPQRLKIGSGMILQRFPVLS